MARRRSFMATRMSKMRGLDRSEKEILVSVGQIVDAAVNNRTPTNPTGPVQKIHAHGGDPRLPAVANLNADTGVRSVKLTWNPVDGSILESYAIRITNLDTGVTTDKTSYTSAFIFKGESGNYKAEIKSIGRNGVASPVRTIVFVISDSVMILEGAKNGNTTQSNSVSEVALTPRDYTAFIWGSFVLNNFASPVQNSAPIVNLLYGDELDTATLIQSITLFPESETATNLNDSDYGGIFRPTGPSRSGNFETSNSVMFAPFEIPEAIADQTTRFWVNITNRDSEMDVVSLSLVVWIGSGGRGELGVTPVVNSINPRSVDLDGVVETMASTYDENSGEMGDVFTVSMWVKPLDLNIVNGDSEAYFGLNPPTGSGFNSNQVSITYFRSNPNFTLQFSITNQNAFGATTVTFQAIAPVADGLSTLFTNGESQWNLLTASWDRSETGADRLKLYMNAVLFATGGSITVVNGATFAPDLIRDLGSTFPPGASNFFVNYEVGTGIPRARYNMMGLWSSALTAAEISSLYNSGAGGAIDWRIDTGSYASSATLIHYWLFGLSTTNTAAALQDYGNSSFALINLSDNAIDITIADDVVTDTPPIA